MPAQSYRHHTHHTIPTYIANALWLPAVVCLVGAAWLDWRTHDIGVILMALSIFVLIGIGRLYTTKLQDRIILLEMQVRYSRLLSDEPTLLAGLSTKQIVALRFASDSEFRELCTRAKREQMSPDQIKKAIQNWRADTLRT